MSHICDPQPVKLYTGVDDFPDIIWRCRCGIVHGTGPAWSPTARDAIRSIVTGVAKGGAMALAILIVFLGFLYAYTIAWPLTVLYVCVVGACAYAYCRRKGWTS